MWEQVAYAKTDGEILDEKVQAAREVWMEMRYIGGRHQEAAFMNLQAAMAARAMYISVTTPDRDKRDDYEKIAWSAWSDFDHASEHMGKV